MMRCIPLTYVSIFNPYIVDSRSQNLDTSLSCALPDVAECHKIPSALNELLCAFFIVTYRL
jgi:hypothetical protein